MYVIYNKETGVIRVSVETNKNITRMMKTDESFLIINKQTIKNKIVNLETLELDYYDPIPKKPRVRHKRINSDEWFDNNVTTIIEVKKLLKIMFKNESQLDKYFIIKEMEKE